jgi:hypothetical protein
MSQTGTGIEWAASSDLAARLESGEWRQWELEERVRFLREVAGPYIRTRDTGSRLLVPGLTRLYESTLTSALHPADGAELYDLVRTIIWMNASDSRALEGFGAAVVEPLAAHVRRWAEADAMPRRVVAGPPPYRIAYLSANATFALGAVIRVIWSCLAGHARLASGRVELFLYATNGIDGNLRQAIESLGVTVRVCDGWRAREGIADVRRLLDADRIDVILADNNRGLATVLFETRSAPLQIYLDMGFPEWGGAGVDYTFLGFNGDAQLTALPPGSCEQIEWRFDDRFVRTPVDPEAVAAQRARFAGARHVFCYVGRLVKLAPEYLLATREILRRVPDTVLYLGGTGDDRELRETLDTFGDMASRVVVDATQVDGPLMMHATDTFLDSFPFFGGLSCLQAQGAGRPVVHLADPRPGYARMQALMRDGAVRATTIGDYIAIAERLAVMPAEWAARSAAAAGVAERGTDVTVCARAIEDVIVRRLGSGRESDIDR